MSAKTRRLLKEYEEALHVRYGETTVRGYLGHVRAFIGWLEDKGIELQAVTTKELLAHQGELLASRKKDGKPYSIGHQQNRISALKSLFRFLVKRSFLLHDPARALEMRPPRLFPINLRQRKHTDAGLSLIDCAQHTALGTESCDLGHRAEMIPRQAEKIGAVLCRVGGNRERPLHSQEGAYDFPPDTGQNRFRKRSYVPAQNAA